MRGMNVRGVHKVFRLLRKLWDLVYEAVGWIITFACQLQLLASKAKRMPLITFDFPSATRLTTYQLKLEKVASGDWHLPLEGPTPRGRPMIDNYIQ